MPDLSGIRRDYLKGRLDESACPDDPIDLLQQWLQSAIEADLASDPTAMVLATCDQHSVVTQRVVLLKGLDQRGLVFYTNLKSRKAQAIADHPRVSLHFSWLTLERQVSVVGTVEKLDRKEDEAYFQSRPRESQLGAWASQQSQVIDSRAELEARLAQTSMRFEGQEVPLPEFWGGFRVKADEMEFWQGGPHRLHDRILYRRSGSADSTVPWNRMRLQP